MSHGFFSTIFYIPLYNGLVFLIDIIPGKGAAIAVLILTIIIRLILFPLSKKAIRTQLQMKQIDPEVKNIREKNKDRNEQGKQIMALYKEKGVNPFAGFFLLLIQFPVLIAIYQVFRSGLPKIDSSILYAFVSNPSFVSMSFLGMSLDSFSLRFTLAALTVITQFIQINLSLPKVEKKQNASFQHDLAYSMNMQMRYIFPFIFFFIAIISSVLSIYFITTNIFMTFQELFVKRKLEKEYAISHSEKTS